MIKLVNRLGTEEQLPLTMALADVPLDRAVPAAALAGAHGSVRVGPTTIQARQITLEGSLYYPDGTMQTKLDELLEFLMESPIEVYRRETDTRCLLAHLAGAPQRWMDETEVGLSIGLVALDPFWYGAEVTVGVTGTQSITVAGSAPTYPIITTVGSAAGLTVSNTATSHSIVVTGVTGVISIDTNRYTCTVGGVSRLDAVNVAWLQSGFALLPGANAITTNRQLSIKYRPRWY